jgi:SAM-dependent methyltransferase
MDSGSPDLAVASPASPLTGTSVGVNVVRQIDLPQLIDGYKRRHDIDISALFGGVTNLRLLQDTITGLSFFDPAICGDSAFYATIARRPGYHRVDKAGFRIAARYVPPAARVLEVGAGIGHFTTHLSEPDYLGLEFNVHAVDEAKALGRHVCARNVCDLAHEQPEKFDVVCAFQVLEHVPDPGAMIAAMVALTRPGGQIILATPNAGAYISRCRDLLNAPPHHITWWEDRTWHWVANKFGLADVQLFHTPIDEMLGVWAQMVASDGIARQLGFILDPVVDESALRQRVDRLAEPVARTMLAGLANRADIPEAGHTTVAVFTKPTITDDGANHGIAQLEG